MLNLGFSQQGTSLALSLHVHERIKACSSSSISKQAKQVSPNEYLLNRRDTKCPDLDLNINPLGPRSRLGETPPKL